jgi:1,4-alpha-glucan branching enzyme
MPGDEWQRFANLRAYYAYMFAHPGKKLLFMGDEFAQRDEWQHDRALDWQLLRSPLHGGVQLLVKDLNRLYRNLPALHEVDFEPAGFSWLTCDDRDNSVFAFLRFDRAGRAVVAVSNLTPVPREDYALGVPAPGLYRELLNTDATEYGGSGVGNCGAAFAEAVPRDWLPATLHLRLPPLATLYLRIDG